MGSFDVCDRGRGGSPVRTIRKEISIVGKRLSSKRITVGKGWDGSGCLQMPKQLGRAKRKKRKRMGKGRSQNTWKNSQIRKAFLGKNTIEENDVQKEMVLRSSRRKGSSLETCRIKV